MKNVVKSGVFFVDNKKKSTKSVYIVDKDYYGNCIVKSVKPKSVYEKYHIGDRDGSTEKNLYEFYEGIVYDNISNKIETITPNMEYETEGLCSEIYFDKYINKNIKTYFISTFPEKFRIPEDLNALKTKNNEPTQRFWDLYMIEDNKNILKNHFKFDYDSEKKIWQIYRK